MATSNRFAAAREAAAKEASQPAPPEPEVVTPSRAEAPSPSKPRKGGEEGQKPSTASAGTGRARNAEEGRRRAR